MLSILLVASVVGLANQRRAAALPRDPIEHYIVPIHAGVPADTPSIPWPAARDAAFNYSGVHLQPGDMVTITVTGRASASTGATPLDANGAPVDPLSLEGARSGAYWVTVHGPPAGIGSVVGTIKTVPWAFNDWFLVGTHYAFKAQQAGELVFLFHDEVYGESWVGAFSDNSGGFVADVQVQRASSVSGNGAGWSFPNDLASLYNWLLLTPLLSIFVSGIVLALDWRRARLRPNPPPRITQFLRYVCIASAVLAVLVHLLTLPLQIEAYLNEAHASTATLRQWGLSAQNYVVIILLPQKITLVALFVCAYLLMVNQPHDRMALLTALAMITFTELVADNPDFFRKTYPMIGTLPVDMLKSLAHATSLLLAFSLPNGRVFPRWARWPLAFYIGWYALSAFGGYAAWNIHREVVWDVFWRLGIPDPTAIYLGVWWLAAIVSQGVRYAVAASLRERKQMRWVLFGLVLGFVGWYVRQGPFLNWDGQLLTHLIRVAAFHLGFGIFAISVMLAVLRNHLFDIDLIIRRSLVWGAMTAFAVGSYIFIVGYIGSLLQSQNSTPLSLGAVGFVAICFNPVRAWLQRGVNHLFYGQRDEPYAVITQLSERLQATLSPDAVLPIIAQTLQAALKTPYVAVAFTQLDGSTVIRAAAGTAQPIALRLPLIYNNREVGQLHIAARQRNEVFDAVDQRFVNEFAHAAAAAVHAVRLTDDLQQARQQLVNLREEERRRLRRDLHDGLGPALASISMQTDAARNLLPVKDQSSEPQLALAREMLGDVTMQAQATMQTVRQLIHGLRPPALDDLGLIAAMRALAAGFNVGTLQVIVTAPETLPPLPAAVEVAVYRIVQEAMLNVVKHAQAAHCEVSLTLEASMLHLAVCDDGRGMAIDRQAGVGLSSMRERAEELGGKLMIEPAAGGGTRVLLTLPLSV